MELPKKKSDPVMHKILDDHEWKHYQNVDNAYDMKKICTICGEIEDDTEYRYAFGGSGGVMGTWGTGTTTTSGTLSIGGSKFFNSYVTFS